MDPTPPPPPTEPDPYAADELFHEPPRWPKVVGTVSIVWGGLSLTCAGCGVASTLFAPQMMKMAEAQMGTAPSVMLPTLAETVIIIIGVLWAVLLIVAGVLTVTRSPAGRPAHLVWAVGSLLLGLIHAAVTIQRQMAIADWAAQNPGSPWAQQNNPMVAYVALAVGMVLAFAWPIFCLVWFGFVKRRPEDMTGGVVHT